MVIPKRRNLARLTEQVGNATRYFIPVYWDVTFELTQVWKGEPDGPITLGFVEPQHLDVRPPFDRGDRVIVFARGDRFTTTCGDSFRSAPREVEWLDEIAPGRGGCASCRAP